MPCSNQQAQSSVTVQPKIVPKFQQRAETSRNPPLDVFISDIEAGAVERNSQNQVTDPESESGPSHSDTISRQIRQAGELALGGDTVRATEIFRHALKQCQGTNRREPRLLQMAETLTGIKICCLRPQQTDHHE